MNVTNVSWLAFRDIIHRYSQVFRAAWGIRSELESPHRLPHEHEFQPAALALRDTPLHPAPRIAIATIIVLLTVAIGWATFGKVDVVATASGKIVPSGEVKMIQPQDTAVVLAIHVVNGQKVSKGQALIDLDATDALTSASEAQSQLAATSAEAARGRAMLKSIDQRSVPTLIAGADVDQSAISQQRRILAGEYADFSSTLHEMDAEIAQAQAGLHEAGEEIGKIEGTLPIEETKEKDYAELIVKGYVGKHDYYNEQQAVIQMRSALNEQRSKLIEMQAALDTATRKREAYIAQTRRTWLEKVQEDETKIAALAQDFAKARNHSRLMELTAPESGTVQQLAVHTVGGVVTPAQAVMIIVPDNRQLMIEATIDNGDIGFVKVGQPAEIKIEAFPFTRYGTLHGTIVQVANDAKQDENKNWVFTAQVTLPQDTIQVEDREINLTPGMTVTTEIKTDRRRVISYLLSPLIQHARESLHER